MNEMLRITTLLILIMNFNVSAQTNVAALLDTVLLRTKETSLYVETINWDSLQNEVYAKAENAEHLQDLKPAFNTLINGLRDHHARIMNAKDYSYLAWFSDYEHARHRETRAFDEEIGKIINDTALHFEYKLLPGNIGYLKIVGIAPNVDVTKESQKIRDAVVTLHRQHVEHWIIDLRYNGGGNIHPMLSGIAPLVGEGIVGSTVNLAHENQFNWEIKQSNFIYAGYQAMNFRKKLKFKKSPKIAVLTSRWTVSSGEIVAIALKGKANTKFFGEATGGYTTNVGWDIINDEVILLVSTGIYCDRNGTVYEQNVPVDVEIPFKVVKETEKDPCVIEATNWLQQK